MQAFRGSLLSTVIGAVLLAVTLALGTWLRSPPTDIPTAIHTAR